MKKVLTAAIAATLALGSVGVASAAEAQSRGHDRYEQRQDRRDDRNDRREYRQDDRNDRREYRQNARDDRREYRQEQRQYARWQQAQRRYDAGRYYAPRGYQVRTWSYGQRMPSYYRSNQYVVRDYGRYGLRQPPHGYQYVRSGNDVVMTAIATGLITAVIAGMFN
ncbi:RcnB family protein [Brevundimonas lenta]|uniref:Ni/Co efflux regulator RcnB n=1 Tax=Brevundimonas lenta TaxID=424796 RepID=A0A7W6JEG1_9CAUL|nr:RcnB family protein [Brevundimonas lenta]MBB4082666.1 Ni/Co efflux regulator RcnB [Brevundimonas lenta]